MLGNLLKSLESAKEKEDGLTRPTSQLTPDLTFSEDLLHKQPERQSQVLLKMPLKHNY